jgi:ribosome-binding protein aMBF1 (putative translation factor)
MAETTSMKEACSCCGSSAWTEAHYTAGGLTLCDACYRCIAAAKKAAMPPTVSQRAQLELWVRGPSFSRSLRSRDTDTPAFPFSGSVASGPFPKHEEPHESNA